jgi:hypothetical protein
MLDLVDATVVDPRRFCDLPLGIPLLDRLSDQAVSRGIKRGCAADFVSYPSEAGQRVLACHSISSTRRCALQVAIALVVSTARMLEGSELPDRPGIAAAEGHGGQSDSTGFENAWTGFESAWGNSLYFMK